MAHDGTEPTVNELVGPEWLTMDVVRYRHEERLAEIERDRLAARATEGRRRWWRRGWWGRSVAPPPVAVATTGPLAAELDGAVVSATDNCHPDDEEALAHAGMSASEHV